MTPKIEHDPELEWEKFMKMLLTVIQYFFFQMFVQMYFDTPAQKPVEDTMEAKEIEEAIENFVNVIIREQHFGQNRPNKAPIRRRGNANGARARGPGNRRGPRAPFRRGFANNRQIQVAREASSPCTRERFRVYGGSAPRFLWFIRWRTDPEVLLTRAELILCCAMRDRERSDKATLDGLEELDNDLYLQFLRM